MSNPLLPAIFFEQLLAAGTRTGTFTYHLDLGAGDFGFLSMSADATVSAIPEPSMLLLLGSGLVGVAMVRRRRAMPGVAAAA